MSIKVASGCECPPCPGRGRDGHGCAECCFGTGVVADMDCPEHGATDDPEENP